MTPFRPRNPEENMSDYLKNKEAYESGQNMNQTNANLGVSYAPGFVPTPAISVPQPTPTPQAPVIPPQAPTTQVNGSIVDYLNSQGQASDFNTRTQLAQQYGIQGYTGTAQQNTQLLGYLQGGQKEQEPKDVIYEGETDNEMFTEEQLPEQDYSNDIKNFLSQNYGIDTSNLGTAFSDPVANIKKIIEDVMASTGMPEIKNQLDTIAKAKTELENQMNEEIASVNDNPWLSEGLRQKKVQAIQDKYESKVNSKINEFNLLQDMYNSARQEAQYAATLGTNMYQDQRNFLQSQLEFMTNAAEKVASAKTTNNQVIGSAESGYQLISYDKQGNIISQKQLTKGGGTSGALNVSQIEDAAKSILDGYGNLYNFPVNQRTAINSKMREIIDSGYTPDWKLQRLTPTQLNQVSEFDTTIASWNRVNELTTELEKSLGFKLGNFTGTINDLITQYARDPKIAVLQAETQKAFQLYRKATTGAQASDKEIAVLRPLLPKLTDRPDVFFSKLQETILGTERAKNVFLDTYSTGGYDTSMFQNNQTQTGSSQSSGANIGDINFTF